MSQLSNISENGAQPSSATGDSTKESGNGKHLKNIYNHDHSDNIMIILLV